MPLIRIDALDDPRLAQYRDLPKSNLTVLSGRFVVEGRLLVERLVASDYGTDSLNAAAASAVFLYHFTHVARDVRPGRAGCED